MESSTDSLKSSCPALSVFLLAVQCGAGGEKRNRRNIRRVMAAVMRQVTIETIKPGK